MRSGSRMGKLVAERMLSNKRSQLTRNRFVALDAPAMAAALLKRKPVRPSHEPLEM